jgi:hypothetical protein
VTVLVRPIPVDRLLVPAAHAPLPDGFARIRQSLSSGLPATFRLDAELALALYAPTGDALLWRDAQGDEPVAFAREDDEPVDAGIPADDAAARVPVRLVLLRADAIVAAIPLVPAPPRPVPDQGGERGVAIELAVLDYSIHAGNLRDAGDYGSFIDLAWRRIDRGTARFSLPALDPRVAARFAGIVQSELGRPDDGGSR